MLTNQHVANIMLTNQQGKDEIMIKRFEDFVGSISAIHKNIQKIKKNKMKEFGLSGNHVMCLFYLAQHPEGITASQLCQLISVDKAAVSRALSELVKKEYVYYPDMDEHKKYRAVIMLTSKGKQATEQIDRIIRSIVCKIGIHLTVEERENMYNALDIISEDIEKLADSLSE